jgi:hypothetical protein
MLSSDPPSVAPCAANGICSDGHTSERGRDKGHHCTLRFAGERRRTLATPRKGSALDPPSSRGSAVRVESEALKPRPSGGDDNAGVSKLLGAEEARGSRTTLGWSAA